MVGKLGSLVTSTDLVLTITKHLRQLGVVGKFVEFYGPGVAELSIADRATISNMCPEYGATVGYFPIDENTLNYMRQTSKFKNICQVVFKNLYFLLALSLNFYMSLIEKKYNKTICSFTVDQALVNVYE